MPCRSTCFQSYTTWRNREFSLFLNECKTVYSQKDLSLSYSTSYRCPETIRCSSSYTPLNRSRSTTNKTSGTLSNPIRIESENIRTSSTQKPQKQKTKPSLRDLAASLNTVAEELQRWDVSTSKLPILRDEDADDDNDILVSPLERRLTKVKEYAVKQQATPQEKNEYGNNPWARMLASPLRQDSASRQRFPEALLMQLGPLRSPDNDQVYLLPEELSDLDLLNERFRLGLKRANKERGLTAKDTATFRILTYKLRLEELTDDFMVWNTRSNSGKTKQGAIARRLAGARAHMRYQKAAAYSEASREYWKIREKTGDLDGDLFKKPESPLDNNQLQWDPAISEKVSNIMRQRVLIALRWFAKKQEDSFVARWRHPFCLLWPSNNRLDINSLELPEVDAQPPQKVSENDFWNDMGDIESGDAIAGGYDSKAIRSLRPPISIKPSEISVECPPEKRRVQGRYDHLEVGAEFDPRAWLPGSFLLHIGPPSTAIRALPYLDSKTMTMPDTTEFLNSTTLGAHNKLIPPMIQIGEFRLPVFNLFAMLGPDPRFAAALVALLKQNRSQLLINSDSQNEVDYQKNTWNYIIMVRSNSSTDDVFAKELWQLWRYLGGTDCLVEAWKRSDTGSHTDDESSDTGDALRNHSSYARHEKASTTYKGLSEKAWAHLYELLELKQEVSVMNAVEAPK